MLHIFKSKVNQLLFFSLVLSWANNMRGFMNRIGFACKYMHHDQSLPKKELEAVERYYNTRTTTAKWLNSVDREIAEERLFSVISHNLQSQLNILEYVYTLPRKLHMMRLSSDLLPMYTHHQFKYFYQRADVKNLIETGFAAIGHYARSKDIRLSMHPGQFCVLASANQNVVEKSIEEFEYHADMIRMMGYGISFQDFKCNIHISGHNGVAGVLAVLPRLSEVAINTITFENEEKKFGLNACLELADYAPVVLDVHHCWINENDYISFNDDRVKKVIDSWHGVRPTMHYSQSREFIMDKGFLPSDKLVISELLEVYNKKDLYAHSDYMWNDWTNLYVKEFMHFFDVMFEVKSKNMAVIDYYKRYLI